MSLISISEVHDDYQNDYGVRHVLIYCHNRKCSRHVEVSADLLSDAEPGCVCTRCGKRDTELRSAFSYVRMGTS